MPDAHTVKLSDNIITDLGTFDTTPNIRYLLIYNNRVKDIFPKTFQSLRKLLFLDLDRNRIDSLRDFIFSTLHALLDLFLSNNFISSISERAFHGLESLEFLELSGNRLNAVPMLAVRWIPSKQLSFVILRVNNISTIPRDINTARPLASYELQGNPLRCPEARGPDALNTRGPDALNTGPRGKMTPYQIDIKRGRLFVKKFILIKSRSKYFGLFPAISYPSEHSDITLPLPLARRFASGYYWITPTGRHVFKSLTQEVTIKNFTAENSGVYTCGFDMENGKRTLRFDLLLCLNPTEPDEKQQWQHTTKSPPDDTDDKNDTGTCNGSTNISCCPYWSHLPSSSKNVCVVVNDNSQKETTSDTVVLSTIAIAIAAVLLAFFPVVFFSRRKRNTSRVNSHNTASAAVHMSVQAMAVCISLHNVPDIVFVERSMEEDPNTSLRRLRLQECRPAVETARHISHRVTEALPAHTAGTTEAQIHHYDNDDASDVDEEVHHYASAAPPPLPSCDDDVKPSQEEDANTTLVHGESDSQMENAGAGEEEMPYAIAAANTLYPQSTDANTTLVHGESESQMENAGADEEEMPYATAAANTLYQQGTDFNHSTHERARSCLTNHCAIEENREETFKSDLYERQTDHNSIATARDNLRSLYGSCEET
ncbi:hypothetical protein Bbelb_389820 [Branchiostoma belcheri]|nr:hypothetical protein Bbelb_389820 [Branchiostoma belcheri]